MQDFNILCAYPSQDKDLFDYLLQSKEEPVDCLEKNDLLLEPYQTSESDGDGQVKRRYSCPTRNIYQNFKKYHFNFLKERGISLSHDPRITALLKTNTMSQGDYSYLYGLPQCRKALDEMFSVNYLEAQIRKSGCLPETIEKQVGFVFKFEAAFRHPLKKFPANRQRKPLSLKF